MKKFKALVMSALMAAVTLVSSVSALAEAPVVDTGKRVVVAVSYEATMDENIRTPRFVNPEVTDSYVELWTSDWWYFSADGYVTVEDDGEGYYHYSRAELWGDGDRLIKDSNRWGYGEVESNTQRYDVLGNGLTEGDLDPRIFYGW